MSLKTTRAKRPRNTIRASATTSYLMMSPWLFLFFWFTVVPIGMAVYYSFTAYNMIQPPVFIWLDNFKRMLLDDDVFIIAFKNTLIFAIAVGPIGYIMSFLYAWSINELSPKLRALLTLLFYAPNLAVSVFFVWQFIFDNDAYGLANSLTMKLGIFTEPQAWRLDPKYTLGICIVVALWMSAGQSFIAFIAGLQSLNSELFEAGAIDGIKNRWQELWFVTLPQMKPQLLLGSVLSISTVFGIGFSNAQITGMPSTDYSTHTLILMISDVGMNFYELGYACAIQLVLLSMMLISWYVITKALSRWGVD